jgi:hypothetical protein
MALLAFLVLLMFFSAANAAPTQPDHPTYDGPTSHLSNEAIVGLVSLFVAVFGIAITLIASSKMRKNIKSELVLLLQPCASRVVD